MWRSYIWDFDPGGNVEHVADNDLTVNDVEFVLNNPVSSDVSRSSGLPCVFGYTPDGRYVFVVYREIDAMTIEPVTAYEVPEPGI